MTDTPPTGDQARSRIRSDWYAHGYYGDKTLFAMLADGADRFGGSELIYETTRGRLVSSLSETLARGRRIAAGLAAAGLRRGDVVISQVPNWPEGASLFAACAMLGLVVVPVIHIYGPAELEHILSDSRPRALVVPDQWRKIDYLERLRQLGPAAPDIVIVIGSDVPDGAIAWSDLEAHGSLAEPDREVGSDDCCLILYTSGTSARPKGVRHSHNSVRWEVISTLETMGWTSRMVLMNPAPAGHMSGLLGMLRPFAIGCRSVFMDAWDARRAVELVDEYAVTCCNAPSPLFLTSLLAAAAEAGSSLASLSEYAIGGATVPPSVVEAADAHGITAFRTYGSSEHPTVSTGTSRDPLRERAYTDGRATLGTTVRILDDQGRDLPVGREGEIAVIGPEQFIGYTGTGASDSFDPQGYFLTGDIGKLDENGYLSITDRKKDIIIRGGENLSSREIEQVVADHPAVHEAAAVAVPDEKYGEVVGVAVVLVDGASLEDQEMRRHFGRQGIAPQKTPEHIMVLDSFPRTASGKVRKAELRRLFRDRPAASH
jgi:acyl-coenzyme A synthetase/AMP-(fatty) acid ligase